MSSVADTVGSGRLAELTIALSLATDLGTGQPMEHGLRTCWLSLAAAEVLDLDRAARSSVYYVALLRFVGCTSDASETAVLAGGDDVAMNGTMAPMLMAGRGESTRFFVRHLAEDLPLRRRAGRVVSAMLDPGMERRSLSGHCEVGARLAARLGLDEQVCEGLAHAYERWDGKGLPGGLTGEEIPVAVRVVTVARDVELWARSAGWTAASRVLVDRRDHGYDPAVVDVFLESGERWLSAVGEDLSAAVLDAEPSPALTIDDDRLDEALAAVADFADLKSWFFRGHAPGVARLAGIAADAAGMSADDAVAVRRAGLVHDVGRVGVPSGIWDHPGPLTAEMIDPFIERRHGREPVRYDHPKLEPILRGTYGVILYQEQVLEIASALAGFTLGQADSLRRAMTTDRSPEEMAKIRDSFLDGALAQGVTPEVAERVWKALSAFAAYGFCKAHAAAFANTAYQTEEAIQALTAGRTALVIPSRLATLRSAERVFVFHEGKLCAQGTHQELLQSSDLYRHVVYLRFTEVRTDGK